MASPEAQALPTGEILVVDGTRVHAQVEGEGPVVILIHGASGNLRDFTFDLAPRLSSRYRVIAFDRPGLGLSDPLPGWAAGPQAQAALLDAAAAQLGVRHAVIVGHSYGGAVAMAWALERPGRVAAVVSLAGAVEPWEGGLDPWYRVAASWLGGVTVVPLVSAFAGPRQVRQTVAEIFAPDPVPGGYIEHVATELSLRPAALRASARQVNTLKLHLIEMAGRYPSLGIPIEIVHGSADTTVGLEIHSRRLAQRVPGARLTVLEGVGHMPHHADPAAVVAAIDRAAARAGLR